MANRKVRIGIDVGGTFTKAVVIDDETYEVIGKYECLTTHDAPEGVAKGVVDVFYGILKEKRIDPNDVVFVAHSTTQATNALLEGDVAPVGIIGMAKGVDLLKAKSDTNCGKIELASGKMLKTCHRFLNSNNLCETTVKEVINSLLDEGVKVIVASEAFGVDDPSNENMVFQIASKMGLPAALASDISKLYGLKIRTRTAVINASIMPKMIETADMTEASVRRTGIKAPLMIMRGDGGVMDLNEMRKRPIMVMLSGPAASVAGALMYLRVTDGIFFEVGGTSTNIGVIHNGRPMVKYVELGGHKTFLNSLDVRVLGVAGGSMPRVKNKKIVDTGPRSAHIAGLPYSAFAKTEEMRDPKLVFIAPKRGDPNDYVAIQTGEGKIFAVTNTCAANALGLTKPGDYAYGNSEASKRAIQPLANYLGLSVEETATKILEKSCEKIIKLIETLIEEYDLDKSTTSLVGGGGGAAALIPFTAKRLGMDYKISDNAEVISSIGVALAMVKDMVERTIVNPTPEDIVRLRKEAEEAAIKSGAAPGTIQVFIEIDSPKKRVRATALGATDLRTKDLAMVDSSHEEKRFEAAKSMHVSVNDVKRLACSTMLDVYCASIKPKGRLGLFRGVKKSVRVVDNKGVIKLSIENGHIIQTSIGKVQDDLVATIDKYSIFDQAGRIIPKVFIIVGGRIFDYSGLNDVNQILALLDAEFQGMNSNDPAVIVYDLR